MSEDQGSPPLATQSFLLLKPINYMIFYSCRFFLYSNLNYSDNINIIELKC